MNMTKPGTAGQLFHYARTAGKGDARLQCIVPGSSGAKFLKEM